MTRKFCGSWVALVTPMNAGGDIDYGAMEALVQWHIGEGSDGILVAGTSGESPTLATGEHQALIAKTVQFVNGKVPVLAGVGSNSTAEAVELTRQAYEDGADAGLSVVPYYNKPVQEGLYRHFMAVAEKVPALPVILYDIPGRCVVGLQDDTVAALARCGQIVGIKDATGDISRVARLRDQAGDDFTLLSGDDKTCREFITAGGDGVISVTANIAPKHMWNMVDAARRGERARAEKIDALLQPFHVAQGVEANPIPVKAALQMMGKIESGIRLPLTPLAAAHRTTVQDALKTAAQEVE